MNDMKPPTRPGKAGRADGNNTSRTKHQWRIGHIMLQQMGTERTFLRKQQITRCRGHRERGARQHAAFSDVGTDDDGNAAVTQRSQQFK